MKKALLMTALTIMAAAGCSPKSEMDRFIGDLMSKMTLEEKIGQLNLPTVGDDVVTGPQVNVDMAQLLRDGQVGAVLNLKDHDKIRTLQEFAVDSSRMHIPLLFGLDVIHGYRTIFPEPLALSCSWDPSLVEKASAIAAKEATACGINWNYSPMVDIAHDARWGRIAEGAGEDPVLGAAFARAYVRGYQGDLSGAPDRMLACVKHYALYGAPDGGLDYTAADMSRARMFNCYMAPYQAAVDAGVASVMTCFNEVEGVPGAANGFLMKDILLGKWGFDGFVVADYNAVAELCNHGLGSPEEVTVRSINAGMHMDMCSGYFIEYLADAVRDGRVSEKTVDNACRKILEAKYKAGLFDDPYHFLHNDEREELLGCGSHHEAAREIAAECAVLLKNEGSILPLDKEAKIALIGPYGDESLNIIGNWNADGRNGRRISLIDGLCTAGGNVTFTRGSNICHDAEQQKRWSDNLQITRDPRPANVLLGEALAAARRADVVVAAVGEPAELSGEGSCRTDLTLPDAQKELLCALKGTGKPIVLVVFSGRPLEISWEDENVDAILYAWFPGSEAGNALADIIYGKTNPSGHLTASFMRRTGQYPYYYNYTCSGRPFTGNLVKYTTTYLDCEPTTLYPFGYGLSYTTFEYGEPRATVTKDAVEVEFELTNTGSRAGKEVAQLYIHDVAASIARPVRELKCFEKVLLEPGESRTLRFSLTRKELSFYNNSLDFVFEPGEFELLVGPDCEHVKGVTVEFK